MCICVCMCVYMFTGMHCWNNNYEVDVYGNVVQFCKDRVNDGSNLERDPNYFARIGQTNPMVCPHSACNCDGLLKQLKIMNPTVEELNGVN